MKTKKYSLILGSVALLCAIEANSQNWVTGGNTLIGTEILGSTAGNYPLTIQNGAAYPINFHTNGSQKATIDANGNFSIGTTSPTNILSLGNGSAQKIWIENTASGTKSVF